MKYNVITGTQLAIIEIYWTYFSNLPRKFMTIEFFYLQCCYFNFLDPSRTKSNFICHVYICFSSQSPAPGNAGFYLVFTGENKIEFDTRLMICDSYCNYVQNNLSRNRKYLTPLWNWAICAYRSIINHIWLKTMYMDTNFLL